MKSIKTYKSKKFTRVYGPSVKTPLVPIAWPALVEPREGMEQPDGTVGAARYEVNFVLDKNRKDVQAFLSEMQEIADVLVEEYNTYPRLQMKAGIVDDVFHDGDDEQRFDPEKYPYYVGKWIIPARNTDEPNLFDAKKNRIDPSKFEAGDLCYGVITPHLGPTGLSFKLTDIQRIKKGDEVMGGGSRVDNSNLFSEEDGETFDSEEEVVEDLPFEEETEEETTTQAAPKVAKRAPRKVKAPEPSEEEDSEDEEEEDNNEETTTPPAKNNVKAPVTLKGSALAEQLKATAVKAAKAGVGRATRAGRNAAQASAQKRNSPSDLL